MSNDSTLSLTITANDKASKVVSKFAGGISKWLDQAIKASVTASNAMNGVSFASFSDALAAASESSRTARNELAAYGSAASTSASQTSSGAAAAAASFAELASSGQLVVPALSSATDAMNTAAAASALIPGLLDNACQAVERLRTSSDAAGGSLTGTADSAGSLADETGRSISAIETLDTMLQQAGETITAFVSDTLVLLTDTLVFTRDLLTVIATEVFTLLLEQLTLVRESVTAFIEEVLTPFVDAFAAVRDTITEIAEVTFTYLMEQVSLAGEAFASFVEEPLSALDQLLTTISATTVAWIQAIAGIPAMFQAALAAAVQFTVDLIAALTATFTDTATFSLFGQSMAGALNGAFGLFLGFLNALQSGVQRLAGSIWQPFSSAFNAFASNITRRFNELASSIASSIVNAANSAVESVSGILAEFGIEVGMASMPALAPSTPVQSTPSQPSPSVFDTSQASFGLAKIAAPIESPVSSAISSVGSSMTSVASSIGDSISQMTTSIEGFLANIETIFREGVSSLVDSVRTIFGDNLASLTTTIEEVFNKISTFVDSLSNRIIKPIEDFFKKDSLDKMKQDIDEKHITPLMETIRTKIIDPVHAFITEKIIPQVKEVLNKIETYAILTVGAILGSLVLNLTPLGDIFQSIAKSLSNVVFDLAKTGLQAGGSLLMSGLQSAGSIAVSGAKTLGSGLLSLAGGLSLTTLGVGALIGGAAYAISKLTEGKESVGGHARRLAGEYLEGKGYNPIVAWANNEILHFDTDDHSWHHRSAAIEIVDKAMYEALSSSGDAQTAIEKMREKIITDLLYNFERVDQNKKTSLAGIETRGWDLALAEQYADAAQEAIIRAMQGDAAVSQFHTGGIIPDEGWFLGLRGEGVLNRTAMGYLGSEGFRRLNEGRPAGEKYVFVINAMDGEDVARVVDKKIIPAIRERSEAGFEIIHERGIKHEVA